MAAYELTGTVKVVMDEVTFDSGFNKREFVVTTTDGRYPQDIKFECVKDKAALLADVKPGQRVTVSFDVRGNENKGRYFVSLSAWRIEAEKAASAIDADDDRPPLDQLSPPADSGDDVLPF
ncbi:MAG: DUF3127 domain-containing protein [Lentisphaerae bacterium]|nr:DUF3127 domain-containing protein [Lentisphaerota bacterium]